MCKGRESQAEDLRGRMRQRPDWVPGARPLPPGRLPGGVSGAAARLSEHPGPHFIGWELRHSPQVWRSPGALCQHPTHAHKGPLSRSPVEGAPAGKEPRFCLAPLGPVG